MPTAPPLSYFCLLRYRKQMQMQMQMQMQIDAQIGSFL